MKLDKYDIWMIRSTLLRIAKENPEMFEAITGLRAEDWRDKDEDSLGFC